MDSIKSQIKIMDKSNQIKLLELLKNIKNNIILKKILFLIQKNKLLQIIKYSKSDQKRLNLTINYYKEYFYQIEIEIIPLKNKLGKFINIKEEDEPYFHIYFNNNEEEIKRNYIKENEEIKIIKIIIINKIISFKFLFCNCECIESLNFKKFYRNNINNMSFMFLGCSSLKELNLNNFNTNNVSDMNGMFSGCSSLKELSLNNFNMNNVTDMRSMFSGCSSLKN